jgi:hypothetical protein
MSTVYILWVYPPPLAGDKYIGGIYESESHAEEDMRVLVEGEAGVDMTDRYGYTIKPAVLITKGEEK